MGAAFIIKQVMILVVALAGAFSVTQGIRKQSLGVLLLGIVLFFPLLVLVMYYMMRP